MENRPQLGRRYAPDPRDRGFAMRAIAPASDRPFRYWNASGWWGDQGPTSQCVAYAWTHWLEDGPVTQQRGPAPCVPPADVYREAQQLDEWLGDNYDGTSVRAGAKALQTRGFIGAYHWADTLEDIVNAVLEVGPVVVGTNWYDAMFDPDPMGFLELKGGVAGGHAYVLNGVSRPRSLFRVKNSWGRGWGMSGHALISFDDMRRLLDEQGEACLATEIREA